MKMEILKNIETETIEESLEKMNVDELQYNPTTSGSTAKGISPLDLNEWMFGNDYHKIVK